MTTAQAHAIIDEALAEIAPEADLQALAPDADLPATLDLDSMDILNLMAAIGERAGTDIPDRLVPRLQTVDALVEHLTQADRGR